VGPAHTLFSVIYTTIPSRRPSVKDIVGSVKKFISFYFDRGSCIMSLNILYIFYNLTTKEYMNTQKELDQIWASGFYLTEDLPKNFGKWSEKKLNKFLVDHAWQPFEYYEADDIWEHIQRLADQGRTYFERNKI